MNTITALKTIVDTSTPSVIKKQGYLDMLKETGMTSLWKTNVALANGFPRIFPETLRSINVEIMNDINVGFELEDRLASTIRVIPYDKWINNPSDPLPKEVFEKLKDARSLNIFDSYHVVAPYCFGKELLKDPLLVGSFKETETKYETMIVTRKIGFTDCTNLFYHIIAWWGHDMDFTKLGLQ